MTIANKLTIARMIVIPIIIAVYYLPIPGATYWTAALFILASITDLIDGKLARARNEVTTFGKFMDPIADKLLVSALLVLLTGSGQIHPVITFVIIAREFIVSGIRLLAVSGDSSNVIAASWLGKIKTTVQIIAIIAILINDFPFSYLGIPVGQIAIWAAAFFTVWSGADYFIKNWKLIGESK
ncbi:MAG: CDP-diacylglycerol--glycerol-3-phosphate 3-phosphatidyltransferase [Clostridia bacterium]|nr:CDP-diacylglycerol--glycerol-3-phosphate 3-phosphatidyltransferase [Clostridia bacterium]